MLIASFSRGQIGRSRVWERRGLIEVVTIQSNDGDGAGACQFLEDPESNGGILREDGV